MYFPIDKLCDEVLLEIFKNLNAHTLKEASLVCKRWNDLIGSSPETMRKFTWKLAVGQNFDEIMNFQRRPWKIIILELPMDQMDLIIKLMERHGSQVHSLSLKCNLGFREMGTILSFMPRLESLEVSRTCSSAITGNYADLDFDVQYFKPMRFLECLSIRNMFEILRVVEASKLKQLHLTCTRSQNPPNIVYDFLLAADNLKKLHVNYLLFDQIFMNEHKKLVSFPFKLTQFTFQSRMTNMWWPDVRHEPHHDKVSDGFMAFLDSQAETLEKLDVEHNFHRNAFQAIFTKLRNVKDLHIKFNVLPDDKEFYEALKPMTKLQSIGSKFPFVNETVKKGILKSCPEIRKFHEFFRSTSLQMRSSGILEFISIHNKKIESLSLMSIYTHEESIVKIERLRTVNIHKIEDRELFMNFLRVNSTIEKVHIRSFKEAGMLRLVELHALVSHPAIKRLLIYEYHENLVEMNQWIKNDRILSDSIENESKNGNVSFKFKNRNSRVEGCMQK